MEEQRGSKAFWFIPLILILALGAGLYVLYRDTAAPQLSITPELEYAGLNTVITVTAADAGSGLKALTVTARKGDKAVTLLEERFSAETGAPAELRRAVSFNATGLADGEVVIEATATDASLAGFGKGNTAAAREAYTLDTRRPMVSVTSGLHYIKPGGACLVTYTADEELAVNGVAVGEDYFPGHKQPSGDYACLFAYPHDMEAEAFAPVIVAEDAAGNQRKAGFNIRVNERAFHEDVINLPDSFLNRKMPEFEGAVPGEMTPLERFIQVNREVRRHNREALKRIGADTAPEPLWEGAFVRLPNSARRAGFGDRRSYRHQGEEVDRQTHLGIDLASLKHAEVPAPNHGRVVYADDMGIYGNVVIIDHGLGLMSLSAHLSQVFVTQGETVAKGQTIGLTGMTGLAGGDHLHFGMLVAGVPVTPVEWWDFQWIKNRVMAKLAPGS